jgi:hypothetical protein
MITDPFRKVVPVLRYETRYAQSNKRSPTYSCWRTSRSTTVLSNNAFDNIRPNQAWAKRCVGIESFGEAPLRYVAGKTGISLQLSRRNVVAAGVRCNVLQSLVQGHVLCIFADDDAEFALVVGLIVLSDFGDNNVHAVIGNAGVWFEEDEGIRRGCPAGFFDCDGRSVVLCIRCGPRYCCKAYCALRSSARHIG